MERVIRALDLIARKGPLGVRAVARQLDLPLGSLHRLLLDLEKEGVVARTPDGEWEMSFRLLEITSYQLGRAELPRLARPFAERLSAVTHETVNVNVLNGLEAICIDKVRGNEAMQMDLRIGARGPIYYGGAGKAMLAYLPDDERREVLNGPLEALTPNTIVDSKALEDELGRIRRRGYSIDNQEIVLGVYCVAVAVLRGDGRPVGAISITGPSPKAPGKAVMPLVKLLSEACENISRRLGYAGEWPPTATASGR
jgi:DNA-binding IclR family transcriptional regulator